jgi:hypothetical protein
MRPDKTVYWESTKIDFEYDLILHEWVKKEVVVTELSPENSPFALRKTMDVDVCLMREKEDNDSVSGKSMFYYVRKMRLTVKPEFENVWLTMGKSDNRVYVKDLLRMVTYRHDLATDEMVTAKKLSEKRISKEDALKLKTGYVFSKFEETGNGETLYGMFVKPSNQ